VTQALEVAAAATGWICGKRLAPVLPELIPALEKEGALRLDDAARAVICGVSAATIDRRLAESRRHHKPRGLTSTQPGSVLKSQIPICTYTTWDEEAPGFLEIDVVAHGGASAAGAFAYTLDAVDSATGWTECAARPHKSQSAVVAALRALRTRFPFPLRGIDSDNGSAFINALLAGYCDAERLTFTRCRAYHKNDQAHVVSAGVEVVEVRNVAGLSCTTSSAFIFPGSGRSWASNSVLAALVSPSPLVHLKAARLCRSKALGRLQ